MMNYLINVISRHRRLVLVLSVCLLLVLAFALRTSEKDRPSAEHSGVLGQLESLRAAKAGGEGVGGGEEDTDRRADHKLNWVLKSLSQSQGKSSDKPDLTSGVKMAASDAEKFDAEKVLKLFSSCRGDGDILSLDCYVDAYEELCKLFRLFGTIFSFVTSDVEEKIGILRDFRKAENAESYKTIQSMLDYEVANSLTNMKKRPSGARTLLRLHRALEFISALLMKIRDTDNSVKFSSVATKAYDETLAKHHPWLVKKAVHVAMYMLPSRPDLLNKMSIEDSNAGKARMTDLIDELNVIYNITQKLYEKDNLLDLP
ncbi:ceramide-1-phosphate transfer protein [Aplysia californica]|uniref:Ceramide-1-phosphate transfer protein n=1 Tax=Aplysia californica TaxID=6500 RepID=A0ABM0JRZ8_APLCA|nr:ceramide-1-phosphate transfer protein [Aplysia californica]